MSAELIASGPGVSTIDGAELRQMMQQMAQIVLDQKAQRHRLTGANAAGRFQLSRWQVRDDMSKMTAVTCPQCDQSGPRFFFNGLHTHPILLFIAGKVERALQGGAHEPLMVIRGRIDQMSEDLLR